MENERPELEVEIHIEKEIEVAHPLTWVRLYDLEVPAADTSKGNGDGDKAA